MKLQKDRSYHYTWIFFWSVHYTWIQCIWLMNLIILRKNNIHMHILLQLTKLISLKFRYYKIIHMITIKWIFNLTYLICSPLRYSNILRKIHSLITLPFIICEHYNFLYLILYRLYYNNININVKLWACAIWALNTGALASLSGSRGISRLSF